MTDDLMERIEGCIANAEHDDEHETLINARDKIEAQAAEIEDLKQSLEIWIFHNQRAMGQKPDDARAYAKAWMFRNANGDEPE